MEVSYFSEMLVPIYQGILCHDLEDHNLYIHLFIYTNQNDQVKED
jgi:hypothetical protein